MVKFLALLIVSSGISGFSVAANAADPAMKFELFKDKAGDFRWRLKATDGTVLALGGQGYKTQDDAKSGLEFVKKSGADAEMKFDTFVDESKDYRWRLMGINGQTVAVSSNGYKTEADAERAIASIRLGAGRADLVVVKD